MLMLLGEEVTPPAEVLIDSKMQADKLSYLSSY